MSLSKVRSELRSLGLEGVAPLFPVGANKKPLPGTNGFKDATTDYDWLAFEDPTYLGLRCGKESGITVIDIDNKDGQALDRLPLFTKTATISTPSGGFHLYYKYTDDIKTTVGLIDQVDVRNDGSYVVAPGSPGYKVLNTAVAPWVRPQALAPKPTPKADTAPSASVVEGGRNQYLTRVAGRLRASGLEADEMLAALQKINERRLNPPLDDQEVETIANSVSRYDPSNPVEAEFETSVGISDLIQKFKDFVDNPQQQTGEATGFPTLDSRLGGGLRPNELTVVNAEAKTGKSTFIQQIMYNLASNGHEVAYASREMSPVEEVLPHLLSLIVGENVWQMWKDKKELKDAESHMDSLAKLPIKFSSGYGQASSEVFFAWLKEVAESGCKFIFVDHLHYLLVNPEDPKEISIFIRGIKSATKSHKVHIILIVQPPKLAPDMRLGLNSLRGGASIGQALDNLITLERVETTDQNLIKDIAAVSLTHARHRLARPGTLYLKYDMATTRLTEHVPIKDDIRPVSSRPQEDLDELLNSL